MKRKQEVFLVRFVGLCITVVHSKNGTLQRIILTIEDIASTVKKNFEKITNCSMNAVVQVLTIILIIDLIFELLLIMVSVCYIYSLFRYVRYNPLHPSSYLPTPDKLKERGALVNINNKMTRNVFYGQY